MLFRGINNGVQQRGTYGVLTRYDTIPKLVWIHAVTDHTRQGCWNLSEGHSGTIFNETGLCAVMSSRVFRANYSAIVIRNTQDWYQEY